MVEDTRWNGFGTKFLDGFQKVKMEVFGPLYSFHVFTKRSRGTSLERGRGSLREVVGRGGLKVIGIDEGGRA